MARTPTAVGAASTSAAAATNTTDTNTGNDAAAKTGAGAGDGAAAANGDEPREEPVEEGTIEVRILLDHGDHRPNDVALLTPAELKAGLAAGWADNNPEAIAYAKSLVE